MSEEITKTAEVHETAPAAAPVAGSGTPEIAGGRSESSTETTIATGKGAAGAVQNAAPDTTTESGKNDGGGVRKVVPAAADNAVPSTAKQGDGSADAGKGKQPTVTAGGGKPGSTNRLGLTILQYKGAESTLCNGCGHDAVSSHIIKACYELGIEQHLVAKLSGIGCSSKSPAYFLGRAFGFNSVHGRMPSVATGVGLANRKLILLAVSGDGDTASIGLGQYCHVIRRNLPLVYIVENNGVYGLTKGQFSATADAGAKLKSGAINEMPAIDLCGLALELGATFIARSFSGDPKQTLPLIKAALSHKGTAIIDVLSPCVTFNEHEGSTKSREWARENDVPIHSLGFVPYFEQIQVDYEPGTVKEVTLHDGSRITLKKLDREYDPTDREAARKLIDESRREKQFLTGLIYVDTDEKALQNRLNIAEEPLSTLPDSEVRPSREALAEIMEALK
ncbi:MAG TPA: 2-oxoacid:ferredoxin oxidoreductase subunit beta [Candidatus Obscuribacterales bacterium]